VLFPGARLGLKVFEARYLDLVADCLRARLPFGVVCLSTGTDTARKDVALEGAGVLAHIDEVDAEQPGILQLRCSGGSRFRITEPALQRDNGLWVARVAPIAADPRRLPGPAMLQTVAALAEAIAKLKQQGKEPFSAPYQLDDAGWVANRWCELLPVSLAAKQRLMELEDPVVRLSLVDGYLRDKKVVVG
jgi:Lon protease-like protein